MIAGIIAVVLTIAFFAMATKRKKTMREKHYRYKQQFGVDHPHKQHMRVD